MDNAQNFLPNGEERKVRVLKVENDRISLSLLEPSASNSEGRQAAQADQNGAGTGRRGGREGGQRGGRGGGRGKLEIKS